MYADFDALFLIASSKMSIAERAMLPSPGAA
jgi:hypothetical protein